MGSVPGNRNGGVPIIECTIRYHALNGKVWGGPGPIPQKTVRGLVDTGATHLVATPALIASLGLVNAGAIDQTVVGHGPKTVPTYACDVVMGPLKGAAFTVTDVLTIESDLSGFDVILGWDVLRFVDLSFRRDETFSLSW